MKWDRAENLGDALRRGEGQTLGSRLVVPRRETSEENDGYVSQAPTIEALGGPAWAKHYFPYIFTRPFTSYQLEFLDWGWNVRPDTRYRPRVECEPRGVGKSSCGEALAASMIARRMKRMIGYVSLEETKAGRHFDAIKGLLENGRFMQDYPHCKPKVQKLRNKAESWSRDALITESDAMVVPLSLQGSSRGWKSPTGNRFDCIFLDDVDKLGMSPHLIKKMIELLKGEILAAGDDNTLIIVLQNLIHRDSIVTQIYDHRADILSDRDFKGPYPLLEWYDAEKVDIEGDGNNAKKWVITDGKAFDPAIDLQYAEKLLNLYGRSTFDREVQQEVYKVDDDKDFREWDEVYHVITYSEFRDFFESYGVPVWDERRNRPQIPPNWNVGQGMDTGTTVGHPSCVASFARPAVSSPLHDCLFAFGEICLPKFPLAVGEEIPLVSPGRVAAAIKQMCHNWNIQDSQVVMRLLSHEASSVLATMMIDLPDELKTLFAKWKPKRGSGVPQFQNLLEIDYSEQHPFRPFNGRPRIYFLVPDDQGALIKGTGDKYYVRQPINSEGFARARFEIPLYNHHNAGQSKIDDDFVDSLLGILNRFGVPPQDYTVEEKKEQAMPVGLKLETIAAMPEGDAKDNTLTRRRFEVERIEKEFNTPVRHAVPGLMRKR